MAFFNRQENPPQYSDAKVYKSFLRQDFRRQCAYCERTEAFLGGEEAFEVDHFKPRQRFPELASVYRNLYYSCRKCNLYKSSTWPSDERAKAGFVFADPCIEDPYLAHLREHLDGALDELTACGEFTNGHIRLDRPDICAWRQKRRGARADLGTFRSLEQNLLRFLDFAGIHERDQIEEQLGLVRRLIGELQDRFLIS
jgi:hypothetical protein